MARTPLSVNSTQHRRLSLESSWREIRFLFSSTPSQRSAVVEGTWEAMQAELTEIRFDATEAVLNHLGASRAGVAGVHRRRDWNEDKRAGPDKSAAPLAPLLLGEVPSLWPDLSRSGQR